MSRGSDPPVDQVFQLPAGVLGFGTGRRQSLLRCQYAYTCVGSPIFPFFTALIAARTHGA